MMEPLAGMWGLTGDTQKRGNAEYSPPCGLRIPGVMLMLLDASFCRRDTRNGKAAWINADLREDPFKLFPRGGHLQF
jgi:hypothetical protein